MRSSALISAPGQGHEPAPEPEPTAAGVDKEAEEKEGAWSGRVLNQLQLATLRCVDFFSAAGTADVAVAVGQGSDKTDYTDFMLGKSKNERAAIYILKFPPPTCPWVVRAGDRGVGLAAAVAVAARIYWPHVLCYLRELYNLPFDNVYTHYTF